MKLTNITDHIMNEGNLLVQACERYHENVLDLIQTAAEGDANNIPEDVREVLKELCDGIVMTLNALSNWSSLIEADKKDPDLTDILKEVEEEEEDEDTEEEDEEEDTEEDSEEEDDSSF